jgi:ribosomal protein L40E
MNDLDKERFFQHVDGHKSQYIDQLAEAVAYVFFLSSAPVSRRCYDRTPPTVTTCRSATSRLIIIHFSFLFNAQLNLFIIRFPSISAELDVHLKDVVEMMEWTQRHVERLGGSVKVRKNPAATPARPLPPILLCEFVGGSDSAADDGSSSSALKTLCVYGHLDVQPAAKEDGWDTDPFVLTEKDGKLYGRGSTDDKVRDEKEEQMPGAPSASQRHTDSAMFCRFSCKF